MAADATGIRNYSGSAVQSVLQASLTNVATTFNITPTTNWPSTNFVLTIDPNTSLEEKVLCASLVGGLITVTQRGYDGTSAVPHAANAVVIHSIAALDIAEANYAANTHNLTAKTIPVGADELGLFDSATSYTKKKVTISNLSNAVLPFNTIAINANTNLISRGQYMVTTSGGAITLTLSASPTQGDEIRIFDVSGNAITNNITVNPNGANLQGSVQNLVIAYAFASVTLVYTGATYGWKVA